MASLRRKRIGVATKKKKLPLESLEIVELTSQEELASSPDSSSASIALPPEENADFPAGEVETAPSQSLETPTEEKNKGTEHKPLPLKAMETIEIVDLSDVDEGEESVNAKTSSNTQAEPKTKAKSKSKSKSEPKSKPKTNKPQSDGKEDFTPLPVPEYETIAEPKDIADEVHYFGIENASQVLVSEVEGGGVLTLSDSGFPYYSLSDWTLIINELEVVPFIGRTGDTLELPQGITRGVLLSSDGYRLDFCNVDKITIPASPEQEPSESSPNHLFLMGDLGEKGADGWGIVVEGSAVINLATVSGKTIAINENAVGILLGPNGKVLKFSRIRAFIVPKEDGRKKRQSLYEITEVQKEVQTAFTFKAGDGNKEFKGSDTSSVIVLEVKETYGWNAVFDTGTFMGLSDLTEFQERHGKLPSANGVIIHGSDALNFTGVSEIITYIPQSYSEYE